MTDSRIVEEQGSFRIVEHQGRFAVLEAGDRRSEGAEPGHEVDWTDETEARRLFGELVRGGDRLARTIW